jgi:hypothetical protein
VSGPWSAHATPVKGESLRGMLLNAHGWWNAQIMYVAALVSFGLALIISGIAFVRGRHAAPEAGAFQPVIEQAVPV